MNCSKCKTQLLPNFKVCPFCGTPVLSGVAGDDEEVSDKEGNFDEDDKEGEEKKKETKPPGRREKKEKHISKVKEVEESLEVVFLRTLAEARDKDQKLDAKSAQKLLDLFNSARTGEITRAIDLMKSQRDYLFFLEKHNQSLANQQTETQKAVLENINKIGELTQKLGEASAGGKAKEYMEVAMMVFQIPIFVAIQDELAEMFAEWREKKRLKKEAEEAKSAKKNGKIIDNSPPPSDDAPPVG